MAKVMRVHAVGEEHGFLKPLWVEGYDLNAVMKIERPILWHSDESFTIYGLWGGWITLTPHRENAVRFLDVGAAMKAWNEQSRRQPLRDDGKPNKPLTALTVGIEPE